MVQLKSWFKDMKSIAAVQDLGKAGILNHCISLTVLSSTISPTHVLSSAKTYRPNAIPDELHDLQADCIC